MEDWLTFEGGTAFWVQPGEELIHLWVDAEGDVTWSMLTPSEAVTLATELLKAHNATVPAAKKVSHPSIKLVDG